MSTRLHALGFPATWTLQTAELLEGLARTKARTVATTKFQGNMGDERNHRGASRRWIVAEVENSLRRLGTDHIDLYQLHRPNPDTNIEETLGALSDLIHAGKIRYAGCSTFPADQIVEAHWASERRGLERFVARREHGLEPKANSQQRDAVGDRVA